MVAGYVAELFLAGRQDEASARMPLVQLHTALRQARSTERLLVAVTAIQDSGYQACNRTPLPSIHRA
jgi:hypothetical protein